MDTDKLIKKLALENALKYNGKANPGALIGKVLGSDPSLKEKAKEINQLIQKTVKEVNKLSIKDQEKELAKYGPIIQKTKQPKKKELPTLENTKNMVMRFEPSVSGPLHIGHAYAISLNSEICRKYKGKLMLRIADTNPDNIYTKAYDLIPKDADWITKNNISEIIIQSERMEIYYKYAEDVIKKGHAYVCTCQPEDFREAMIKMVPCPCRDLSVEENIDRWEKMLSTYKEGDAVVRIKTNIKDKNPAMRDWPALRIKETAHPKQKTKYKVWPLLNFAVAVDDHDLKVTHTIRAKDHMDNEKRQKFLFDYMGWKMPVHLYIGRINFKDLRVSCSKTRPLIEDKTYSDWDDIRIPFLLALKRRGYQPEAFIKYALDVGVSQNDKTVSGLEFFKTINAFNKGVIDKKSNRYFFIGDPIAIKISGAPLQKLDLNLHPANKKGGRPFTTNEDFYIDKKDFDQLKDNKLYRLMDCLNFKKKGKDFIFDSKEYEIYKEKGEKIIHWLPKSNDLVKTQVLMPDNTLKKGLAESTISNLKENDIIQFERFGFVRLDNITKDHSSFWYTHN